MHLLAALRPTPLHLLTPAAAARCAPGVGLNNKNILRVEEWRREEEAKGNPLVSDAAPLPDWQIAIFRLVLGAIDAIFTQRWLLTSLLERFATEETVRARAW